MSETSKIGHAAQQGPLSPVATYRFYEVDAAPDAHGASRKLIVCVASGAGYDASDFITTTKESVKQKISALPVNVTPKAPKAERPQKAVPPATHSTEGKDSTSSSSKAKLPRNDTSRSADVRGQHPHE